MFHAKWFVNKLMGLYHGFCVCMYSRLLTSVCGHTLLRLLLLLLVAVMAAVVIGRNDKTLRNDVDQKGLSSSCLSISL